MSTDRQSGHRQCGLTMIELIMFIVIVGIGITGILAVLNTAVKSSADPMVRKNMLAIAESLLEEVQALPSTYCDPDDANATSATSPAGCASTPEALGFETGEQQTRMAPGTATPFDNVNDYHVSGGLQLASPIPDISGAFFAPAGYSATIRIVQEALNGIGSGSSLEAVRIAVTVTRGNDSLTLEGYRTRHSPNAVP